MSQTNIRISIDQARKLADQIVDELESGCDRIEVAGSVRRGQGEVGDIEIVGIPAYQHALFGQPGDSLLDARLNDLMIQGRIKPIKNGPKYKQFLLVSSGLKLDLFLVTCQTWGVQMAIRTGPWQFSKALVSNRTFGGRLDDSHFVSEGRLWLAPGGQNDPFAPAHPLDTPEEADFLRRAGGWLDPRDRHVNQPIHDAEALR